ncbi:MAG: flagellar protein FliS [Actinomycetia bacterium]|nr:flagellar protein FliS [Actinomycetes bacterium]MCP5035294.1 flagellar protein FliS [Actinomycetes bacterium]
MNQRQRAALADRYQTDGMAGSSPQKLLLAVFDRLHRDLDTAVAAITTNRIEAAHRSLVNAQELVYELRLALDPEVWPGATELQAIYDYVLSLLIEANLNKSTDDIERCIAIIVPLEQSWVEAHDMLQQEGEAIAVANGVSE